MNMVNLLIAEANAKTTGSNVLELEARRFHVFDHTGEYRDYLDLSNTCAEFQEKLRQKYKRCIFIYAYQHKDEWRHDWTYIKADGFVVKGIDFDGVYSNWMRAIDPKNRKPWYWERKINALKAEYPHWDTDVQEAVNMRIDCRHILNELESNFNINNNYYRIQGNAAMEAHSIILTCDSMIDAFEYNLARDEQILLEREATGWTDEREDLHM